MKRTFLFFMLPVLLFLSFSCEKDEDPEFVAEQITITKSSLDLTSIGSDVYFDGYDLEGSIDVTSGENKLWDFQKNKTVSYTATDFRCENLQTTVNFVDADYYRNRELFIFGESVDAHEYFYVGDDKIYSKGMSIDAQTVSVGGITLSIPAQEVVYSSLRVANYYPLTYENGQIKQTPEYTRTINATVSGLSAMGIPDGTPVSFVVTYHYNYQVVAWGGIKLNGNNPESVLLMKSNVNYTESIFINGVKADQSQLTPLGIVQDDSFSSVTYSFLNKTYLGGIVYFQLDGSVVSYFQCIQTIR